MPPASNPSRLSAPSSEPDAGHGGDGRNQNRQATGDPVLTVAPASVRTKCFERTVIKVSQKIENNRRKSRDRLFNFHTIFRQILRCAFLYLRTCQHTYANEVWSLRNLSRHQLFDEESHRGPNIYPLAVADTPPLDRELWKKSQGLRPRPSTDTTPVVVKVEKYTYRIPRNYLVRMFNPTIKVTIQGYKIPAFEPLTDETRDCFGSILQGERAGCQSAEFAIEFPYTVTHRELLERNSDLFRNKEPRKGPFGYDIYDIGPENARTEVYTKKDKKEDKDIIFFRCQIFDNNGKRAAVCNDRFPLIDGNSVHFFFSLDQIASVPEIETGVQKFMEKFRVEEAR